MNFVSKQLSEKKLISWIFFGLLVFLSAFLWAPSRDGLRIVFLFSFFIPVLMLFFIYTPDKKEYLNTPTILALIYGLFSVASSFWGDKQSIGFFILQWFVLAAWLCGTSVVLSRVNLDFHKSITIFIGFGCLVIISSITYYYNFVFGDGNLDKRLWGWNVFRNPNELGSLCGVIALLAVTSAFQSSSVSRAYLFYAFAVIGFMGLLLSFSRAALLAFLIASSLGLIITRPSAKIWSPPFIIITTIFIFLFIMTDVSALYFEGRMGGLSDRITIWSTVIHASFNNFFIGIGMSENTRIPIPSVEVFNHAHNAWLDTYYRTGIVGLCLILCHLLTVLKITIFNKKVLPLSLWLCFGVIFSLFDGRCFFWEIDAKWFLYWIPAGLIVAYSHSTFKEKSPSSQN